MTSIDTYTDVRMMLKFLRIAGWKHSSRWLSDGPRDPDGAPMGEPVCLHTWRRGTERIRLGITEHGRVDCLISYEPFGTEGLEFGDVSVGRDWLDRNSLGALHTIGAALGVFQPRQGAEAAA
ncbi:hypothetical protein ACH4T9_12340 [Micromonospora sp. NPDC020750]|uniref:hypothetical protein n=1 Tax=unclassified Micromonospora TaxID=2617518 RepID=UPI00379CE645